MVRITDHPRSALYPWAVLSVAWCVFQEALYTLGCPVCGMVRINDHPRSALYPGLSCLWHGAYKRSSKKRFIPWAVLSVAWCVFQEALYTLGCPVCGMVRINDHPRSALYPGLSCLWHGAYKRSSKKRFIPRAVLSVAWCV